MVSPAAHEEARRAGPAARFTISGGGGRKSACLHRVGGCGWARGLKPRDSVERLEVDPSEYDHVYCRCWGDDAGGSGEESLGDEASNPGASSGSSPSERPDRSPANEELGSDFVKPRC